MITSNIPAYAQIIGQAALLTHYAATEDDPRGTMASYYRGQVQAYGHAARLIVKEAGGDADQVDRDVRSEYERLWKNTETSGRANVEQVHLGTFRETCASHGCSGCASNMSREAIVAYRS